MTIRRNSLILALWLLAGPPIRAQNPVFRNTAPSTRYVGSSVCADCHQDISASYATTAMGRSMLTGDDAELRGRLPVPFTVFDSDAGEYFEVSLKEGAYYQSQFAVDRDGREIFRQAWKVPYVIGSGENGFGFLLQRDGYLFEAPLSYYTKTRAWSFSPGYERRNLAFTRPVIAECIGCHAGRPQPIYNKPGLYRDPPFRELAVGCESCHGPGELHVEERRARRTLASKMDSGIVNPAHLSGWLSDNICMKCHQGGDVRVELPGRHVEDFRPGTPLNQVLAIFKAPPRPGSQPQSVLLEHYFATSLSKCYRSSAGKLSCITCHNPHVQPSAAEAPAYYRTRCLSCHEPANCKLAIAERHQASPVDDCASCHMPKRTVTTITHAALTDHRIVARPDETYPEEVFRAGIDSASGLLVLTTAPSDTKRNVPAITLFQAYASLLKDGHSEFKSKADDLLERLARDSPGEPRVLSALARRSLATGASGSTQAIGYLHMAIKAGSTARDDALLLADLYIRSEQYNEAIAILRQSIREYPYARQFPEALAAIYIKRGEYRTALETIRKALEVFPDAIELRMLQKTVQAATIDGAVP